MKARLPQNFQGSQGAPSNMQQLARQAQKMQEEMENATAALEEKEYSATAGGGAVTAVVTGSLQVQSIDIKPEVIDPEDPEMLADLVMAAINEAIRNANEEKESVMSKISGGISIPGLF